MPLHIGAIDDDKSILYTLEAMASTEGWRMLTTSEPEECLDWVRLDEVDILLVDYHMPVMNGLHVIRKARELSSKMVLIALTVEDGGELASKLTLAGADDFISKPIRLADFTARIRLHEKIFSHREQLNWEERKKGVSKDTMRKVLEKIKDFQAPADCDEIAAACGLAYVTAHRYLEYLSDRGLISRSAGVQDGRPGRPKTYYSIISPSGAQGEKK
ncbi:response regulator [Aminivibrio sp.]|jgi:two-component system response regulator DctR|nr:response regulator [Synergistaceae bacterium]MDD4020398.1 response regulator [Synergistaceae bacterium]NCC59101.1 response regulator [Synergistales bacterium]